MSDPPSEPPARRPFRATRRPWGAILTIVLATAVVFGPLLGARFTNWDDQHTVAENPRLHPPTLDGVLWYWRHPYMDLYVPLTYTAWGAIAAIAQEPAVPGRATVASAPVVLRPGVFHAANVALHIGSALAAFALLRRLVGCDWPAAAGALVFALHPVQVEPVAWVSGLKDVLAGFLSIVAVWQYVTYVQASDRRSTVENHPHPSPSTSHEYVGTPEHQARGPERPPGDAGSFALASADAARRPSARMHYVFTLVALLLATLAKPSAVVVPLVAALIDILILARPWRRVARSVAPLVLAIVPCLIWTKLVQPAPHVPVDPRLWTRPLVAGDALAFYLHKLAWPADLAIDYGRTPAVALAGRWGYVAWVVPAALLAALAALARRGGPRVPLAAGLVFVAGVLPVLGLIPFDFQEFSTVADHYLYLSMLGPALLVAWLLPRARGATQVAAAVVVAVVLVALGARSWFQTAHWRDSTALFTRALTVNPRSWSSHINLGYGFVAQGRLPEAIGAFEAAVALNPTSVEAWQNLAGAYGTAGRIDDAIAAYERTLALDPDNDTARRMLPAARRYRDAVRSRERPATRAGP